MANETNQPSATPQPITLVIPPPGQTIVVDILPNQVIEVPFDINQANVTLVGSDLRLEFPGNAVLILSNFAAMVEAGSSALLMFADGTVMAGDVIFTALTAQLPETAAGPGGGSGGAGEYEDDMGSLLAGISKLGPQNPDPFALSVDMQQLSELPPINDPPIATLNTGTIINGREELWASGNLISNIPKELIRMGASISVETTVVGPVRRTFGDVAAGTLVAYVGSGGTVEVGVREGSAALVLGVGVGGVVAASRGRPS